METRLLLSIFWMITVVSISLLYLNSNKDIHIERKDLEKDIFDHLGDYCLCKPYRMNRHQCYRWHRLLEPLLLKHFFPNNGGSRYPHSNPYLIKLKLDFLLLCVTLPVDLLMTLCSIME